jgi:hypothetical protein
METLFIVLSIIVAYLIMGVVLTAFLDRRYDLYPRDRGDRAVEQLATMSFSGLIVICFILYWIVGFPLVKLYNAVYNLTPTKQQ